MRTGATLLLYGLLAEPASAADARWSRMQSPNFEMYTTAGERSARDTLRYFEQVHSFFAQAMPSSNVKPLPVRIVAFNSMKEFEPYRPNEFAAAYYHSTADCDYIVMSHTGAETFPTAIHEYVHLVVQHAKLNLPPWLNEGVAELYSTLKPMGDKILVGSLVEGRHYALLNEKWVPLEQILGASMDSAYYNEKNKAGSLYNEGWGLTHMLALDNAYRLKFAQLMRTISDGTPSREAMEQTYGKPLSAVEKDLLSYLRGTRFQGALIPAKVEKIRDDLNAEPAPDFEVKLLLTRLLERPGNESATETGFKELIALDPKRPEPHIDLGYLLWSRQQSAPARDEFKKAYELGSRSPKMLWDYGRLEESHDDAAAVRVLSDLLNQDPDRLEVRLELATSQLRAHAAKDAVETLKPVKKVTPQDAPRLLTLVAYANLETGDRVTARNAADQLLKVAQTAEDKSTANRILQSISAQAALTAPQTAPSPRTNADGRPIIRRREAPEMGLEVHTEVKQRPSFSGKFVELQCVDPAKIVLDTQEGKKFVAIDDPTRLVVNGNVGEKIDLTCGRQKPVPIRVEYDPPNRSGIDGLARAIHFNP